MNTTVPVPTVPEGWDHKYDVVSVTVPAGASGQTVQMTCEGRVLECDIPVDLQPGQQFHIHPDCWRDAKDPPGYLMSLPSEVAMLPLATQLEWLSETRHTHHLSDSDYEYVKAKIVRRATSAGVAEQPSSNPPNSTNPPNSPNSHNSVNPVNSANWVNPVRPAKP